MIRKKDLDAEISVRPKKGKAISRNTSLKRTTVSIKKNIKKPVFKKTQHDIDRHHIMMARRRAVYLVALTFLGILMMLVVL